MPLVTEKINQAELLVNTGFITSTTDVNKELMQKYYQQQKPHSLLEIEAIRPTRRSSISEMITDALKRITPLSSRKSSLQEYHKNAPNQHPNDHKVSTPLRRSSCSGVIQIICKDTIHDSPRKACKEEYENEQKKSTSSVDSGIDVQSEKDEKLDKKTLKTKFCYNDADFFDELDNKAAAMSLKKENIEKHKSGSLNLEKDLERKSKFSQESIEARVRLAISNQDHEVLANVLNTQNKETYNIDFMFPTGGCALHHAIIMGDYMSVRLLVQSGADIRMKTLSGLSPTLLAAQCGYFEIAQHLLLCGGDVSDIENGHQAYYWM